MLLSEMFGVGRNEDFMVEVVKGRPPVKYRIRQDYAGVEYLERYSQEDGWQVARENRIFKVIHLAPSGIIHLPPPLTDDQREQLKALYTLGYTHLIKDRHGYAFAYDNEPYRKYNGGWLCGGGYSYLIITKPAKCLESLVDYSDPEPYDIGKALGVEGC